MLTDLRLEPEEEHTTFTQGLVGITPTVFIRGVVKFTSSKRTVLRSIKVLFHGTAEVGADERRVVAAVAADERTDVAVAAGDNGLGFAIDVSGLALPASQHVGTGRVAYAVGVQVETGGTLLAPSRRHAASEAVDVPRYNVPRLLSAARDTTAFISGVSVAHGLDFRVAVSRTVLVRGQRLVFTVHHVRLLSAGAPVAIAAVSTRIRQDLVLLAPSGQAKRVSSSTLAKGAGKLYQHAPSQNKSDPVEWTGETFASIGNSDNDDDIGILSQTSRLSDSSPQSHQRKKKPNDPSTLLAVSTVDNVADLFSVKHFAELIVGLRNGKEVCFDTPIEFEAVDRDTADWLVTHATKLSR
ncbi:hypothetical protein HK100_000376, partial [Physocladia obscura]